MILKHGCYSTKPADILARLDLGLSNNLVYFYAFAAIQYAKIADSLLMCWQFFNAR